MIDMRSIHLKFHQSKFGLKENSLRVPSSRVYGKMENLQDFFFFFCKPHHNLLVFVSDNFFVIFNC